MDNFDIRILEALQNDGSITNAALSEIVHLSPSQCSRRQASLEESGIIERYQACLSADKIGFTLHAIVRLNLLEHGQNSHAELTRWLGEQPEIQEAYSVSGDADYTLIIRARDLPSFSNFIHDKLMIQPLISQVRSEFVLRTLKKNQGFDLSEM